MKIEEEIEVRLESFNNTRCVQIQEGRQGVSILFDNGEVYTNGENSNGEMGVGHEQGDNYGFMRVLGLEDVKVIKMAERQWSNNTPQNGVR